MVAIRKTVRRIASAVIATLTVASSGITAQDSSMVSINVKDSSIGYVLKSIARQGNLRVVYDDADPAFAKKVTVNISRVRLDSAVSLVLKGTGLIDRVTDEGKTLMVRRRTAESDSNTTANATHGNVFGQILDSTSGKGIEGASIAIEGSQLSVKTDSKGSFFLRGIDPGTYIVTVRALGFATAKKSIVVESGKLVNFNVSMRASASTLNEVVTTATGKQRRVDISNDVVKIDAARLMEAAPVRSVTDLLQAAQINGVTITPSSGEPGAPKRIRIGGVGSISQNNDPVVIIDGVWVKSSFSTPDVARQLGGSGSHGAYLPSRLDAIDPNTIETIEVVRGPAAATLYGPDAANGVILITTKRGSVGPARWDLHYSHDRKDPVGKLPKQWDGVGRSPFSSEVISCPVANIRYGTCVQDSLLSWSNSDPLLRIEGKGSTDQLTATVSGGSSQVRYSLSAGLSDQRGTRRLSEIASIRGRLLSLPIQSRFRKPSEMRDRRLSSRLDLMPRPGLDFSLSIEGSQQNSREDAFAPFSGSGFIGKTDSLAAILGTGTSSFENKSARTTRGLVSLVTRWNPYPWSMLTTTFGIDKEMQRESRKLDILTCVKGDCSPRSTEEQGAGRDGSVYTIRAHTSFTPTLGRIGRFVNLQPGVTFDLRRQSSYTHIATTFRETDSIRQSGSFTDGPVSALGGISVNANIRLFNRISFDPAIRHDFTGAKQIENNSKTYPRFGTSWLVSDEPFFPHSFWMSTLRLRGAFGYAAVQPSLSQLHGRYVRTNAIVNGRMQPIIQLSGIGNPHLEPERSAEVELGFDADMLDDRLMMTLTYSNKQNRNTLIDRPLAPSAGLANGNRQENIARVVNHATMIQTTLRPIETDNLRIRLTTNVTFSYNEIRTLGSGVSPFGTSEQRHVAGYPVGGLWAKPLLGMSEIDSMGRTDLIFADSVAYMGSSSPSHTIGNNIEIGFLKHLTFNAFVDYKGPFTQNRNAEFTALRGYWDINASPVELALPRIVGFTGNKDFQTVKELRLQSASISVNVPNQIAQRLGAQSVHVSLQGSNLGLWSKYRGRDPGINSSPIGERLTDNGSTIGIPRSYSLQFRVRY